jgi:hypothetical protein
MIDEQAVRDAAQSFCDALLAGDVDRAVQDLSPELRRNVGEVLALLPLPASEVTIESVEHGASAYIVAIKLVGETNEDLVQTRWKERDGRPTIVEASHLSRTERPAPEEEGGAEGPA